MERHPIKLYSTWNQDFHFLFLSKPHALRQREVILCKSIYSSLYFYDCKTFKILLKVLYMNPFKALTMFLMYNSSFLKKGLKLGINGFSLHSQYCCYYEGGFLQSELLLCSNNF